MKRFLLTLAVLMVSITGAFATVYSGKCGTNVTYTLDTSTGVLKIEGTGAMSSYSYRYLDGVYVTTAPWRDYYQVLKSVTISQGVTSIGDYAFRNCSSLTSITIPNSVTSIGNNAFDACSSLTSITIPESVTSIRSSAFRDCSSLTDVTIPSSVTSIGEAAFYNCSSLTSITIPSSVTSIGKCAFSGCTDLISINVDPNNMVYDSRDNCNAIIETATNTIIDGCKSTTIPESVTSIGEGAFLGCSSLTSVTIPESVTSIGDDAFYNCSSLTSITIPSSVTSIGERAFRDCSSLTSITIPEGVTSIGDNAFERCSSLTSITIPESVTSIGSSAFWYCSSLTSITIPEGVTSIGERAFTGCSSLTSITIPESVTSIGESAFTFCFCVSTNVHNNSVMDLEKYGLTLCDVEQADGLIIIDNWAVNCRTWATSVTIPEGVTSIGDYAFRFCSSLTSITIPEGVTIIGSHAFEYCSSLTSITIPSSVTSIGYSAFIDCPDLISIKVDPNNTVYDSRDNCNAIIETAANTLVAGCKSTTIPESVTSIGSSAFDGCSSLSSINIPEGVTSIVDHAFHDCSSLTSVTIPEGVTSIGNYAFLNCSSLTSVTIPEGVTSIGNYAFLNCSSLTDVTSLATTPPTCGDSFSTYGTLHVLPGCGDAYRAASYWKRFTIVEDAVKDSDTDITALADVVYVNAMEGKIGSQLVLPLQMKNSIEAIGFQADLILPDCVTVAEDEDGLPMVELSTQRTTTTKTNMFDYSYQPDGSLRILCSSTKGYSFTGNDGEVALVTINISEDIEAGDYPIVIKNIVITDAQGIDKKKVDLVKSTLTLVAYALGDVNGDNEVDVADISSLSSYILGRVVPGFVEKAADVNSDTEIDVADISALAYLILHPETAQKAKARKVAEKKENIENAYNTLYAEMLQAEAGTDVVLPIMMRNGIEATGFQLDLVLPEGVTLKDAALSNARTSSKRTNLFDYARQADGTYRILCNSTKGLSFNGHDGEVMLITLHIDKDAELGAQTIALKDMVLTDATGMLREESSLSESTLWVGNATGIHEMASEKSAPTYDLQGRQVSKKQKGIHIQNGKKTVVK